MQQNGTLGTLFHNEVMQGIYQISDTRLNPTQSEKSLAPGAPTRSSYLVTGREKALLFDLAIDDPSLKDYAERLAGKPVQLVLSHGHIDHIFHLSQINDVWMHPADEALVRNGMPGQPPVVPCPAIHTLNDGDEIDLGDRQLEVFHVPGHTGGSILLLDRMTRTLLTGDTCARRLLYGLTEYTPLEDFCASLRRIQAQDFDVMYSAHDRCALPKAHLEHMISFIQNIEKQTGTVSPIPGFGELLCYSAGDQYTLRYFDMAIPAKYIRNK